MKPQKQLELLQKETLRTIREHSMIRAGERVAVACSGGADSTALLCLLHNLSEELGCVVSVAHLNHCLRGAESDGDELFVRELAAHLDLPCTVQRENVAGLAAKSRVNREAKARELRYRLFHSLTQSGSVDRVAVAHTADDQAETVLHRMIRGTGTQGLAGIHPAMKGGIIRPLLGARRRTLRQWLNERRQNWREDSSNQDVKLLRNRIRAELLPLLADYNPRVVEALANTAEIAREEESFWREYLNLLGPRCIQEEGGRVSIEIESLRPLPVAVGWRILRRALVAAIRLAGDSGEGGSLGAAPGLDFQEVQRLWHFALQQRSGGSLSLAHNIRARRDSTHLILERNGSDGRTSPENDVVD